MTPLLSADQGDGGAAPASIVAIGFSPEARPLLERLQQCLQLASIRWPSDPQPAGAWLEEHWPQVGAVVAVGACGLVTRLIAPLLRDKQQDPAVLVLDPNARYVVPLLGGHGAGAERLGQELAALLDAQCVLSGGCAARQDLALDAFGGDWGWRRGEGDWSSLMRQRASGASLRVRQEAGLALWRQLPAAHGLDLQPAGADGAADLVVSPWRGSGCRWHPPCLWLGIGCERDTDIQVLDRLVSRGLALAGLSDDAVIGVASIDRKGDEPALLQLVRQRQWRLRLFSAEELSKVNVPNPSPRVAAEMGTASVAEAAALLAAQTTTGPLEPHPHDGQGHDNRVSDQLVLPKTIERAAAAERGAATLAISLAPGQFAPERGELHLVGSGPGALKFLSGDARQALTRCTIWVGYGLYLDLLEPLRRPDQLRRDGRLTAELERCADALALARAGLRVALISSGDSGIYGMAGLALNLWLREPPDQRPGFTVHPGLSALQLAAARAGAPLMHDFCTISLSDRLTPWPVIEQRLQAAAAGDFVVALYNPRSEGRDWQLGRARELLLAGRSADTPVLLARQLGRPEESLQLHRLGDFPEQQVDMLTLVLIGNSTSLERDGWMLTPRGYPGAELS